MNRTWWVGLAFFAACSGEPQEELSVGTTGRKVTGVEKLDSVLQVLAGKGVTAANHKKAMPRKLVTLRTRTVGGQQEVVLDLLIQGTAGAAAKLAALGAEVRTVTTSGIMTVTAPLQKLAAIAAIAEVNRIEASKPVRMTNDNSNALTVAPNGNTVGMHNPRSTAGAGVVVGVIDSGLDFTHKDFRKDCVAGTADGERCTRIVHYWDQSDTGNLKPPTGFSYGHEYSASDFDTALQAPSFNERNPTDSSIRPAAFDTNGHGTHVTGTAAGDGSGSGFQGVAPAADIVFVKFDFEGDRNTDASIIDGVSYIFQKAAAMGKPAVINMSLGSDFGPHDGTSLEERGIDDLTGPGKVVVVAAGNPGTNNWSSVLSWGFSLHGSGALGSEPISFRFPTYTAGTDNYAFLDIWYPAGNKCRVKVTTPTGKVYPPSTPAYKNTWVTGSAYVGFNTTEGGILVGNGGDQLDWGATTTDNEAYVELSDYFGTLPVTGTWTIQLVPADTKSKCAGTYHAWYGASDSVVKGWKAEFTPRSATPRFGGRESDNKVTIGNPASASKVIAVAAYLSRESWQYAFGTTNASCDESVVGTQAYGQEPINYYDPFALGELSYFSARGPRRDGVLKPEIATPGVGIASSFSHFVREAEWDQKCVSYYAGGPYHFGTNRVTPNLEATVIQGTSMACPNATGAIALFLEKKGTLDAACLRKLFAASARYDTATDTHDSTPNSALTDTDTAAGPGKPNNDWGYGKLDIDAGLSTLAGGFGCEATPPPPPPCSPAGAACTASSQCCSLTCAGKPGKKICK